MVDAAIEFRPGRFGRSAVVPGVWIREVTDGALASIVARRGRELDAGRAAQTAFGTPLPQAGRAEVGPEFAFLWSGPGQWLGLSPADGADVESRLAVLGDAVAVFDQSDGRVVLDIGGPRVRDALAKGVSVDLADKAFPAGAVALTAVSHLNVTLWRLDAAPRYRLLVVRTYFESFWRWVAAAAAEYGGEVLPAGAYSHAGTLPGR